MTLTNAIFYEIVSTKTDLGIAFPTFRFSVPVFTALTTLYPLVLLPVHFIGKLAGFGSSIVLSLFGGICVSTIVEYCYFNSFPEAFFYSFFKGLPFAVIWIGFMHCSRLMIEKSASEQESNV